MNPAFLEFAFPPRYHYDVLRALDHFRNAGGPPDPRIEEASISWSASGRRTADGSSTEQDEALGAPLPESVGEPSRWNTLRALRVLRWARPTPSSY